MSDTVTTPIQTKFTLEQIKEIIENYMVEQVNLGTDEDITDGSWIGAQDNISDEVKEIVDKIEAKIHEEVEGILAEIEESIEDDDDDSEEDDTIDPIPDTDVFDAYDTGDAQAPVDDLKLS